MAIPMQTQAVGQVDAAGVGPNIRGASIVKGGPGDFDIILSAGNGLDDSQMSIAVSIEASAAEPAGVEVTGVSAFIKRLSFHVSATGAAVDVPFFFEIRRMPSD